jgi:crossover junction endodeoxyribonuclease RusA
VTTAHAALVIIDAATTQTRQLKKFVRRHSNGKRNLCTLRMSLRGENLDQLLADKRGAHDVDNVARRILDALSGVFLAR